MRLTLLLALLAFPAFADEKPKPNTLTPKEIADGWILLFDGETTFGWKVEGEAKVKDGKLLLGGKTKSSITSMTVFSSCEMQVALERVQGKWRLVFDTGTGTLALVGTEAMQLKRTVKLGTNLTSEGGNVAVITAPVNLRIETEAGNSIELHSFFIRPKESETIFNAKDLTGWKTYDPAKAKVADPKAKEVKVASKFTVTKEGWLNVKDGGGDLQTEGQWADFVLQFECISNGKHLNSGMFFRCITDLYQQGYEAQIRNEWMGDDRTKPVDFGTGAIYRRQPARKVVSTDGEWFTMTVAAHGRHIATWVNGYQAVDWTDDRKEADNARQGFKKSKGALSIQGHDPTTDLSFRNIRIQSLDGK